MELYGYASALVTTNRQKVSCFIRALPTPMHKTLIGHPDLTFAETVDRARQLEELDGGHDNDGTEKFRERTWIELHDSRPGGSSMSRLLRGELVLRRPRVRSLQGASSGRQSVNFSICYKCHQPGHKA